MGELTAQARSFLRGCR